MSSLGGQPEEEIPGYALDLEAAKYDPLASSRRYERGQLAHWAVRIASSVIDSAVIGWPVIVLYTATSGHRQSEAMNYVRVLELALLVMVASWEGRTGRTPGKALLRLRLVDQFDGQPVGTKRAYRRRVAHALDALSCGLGFLWPLWDAQRQTFADKVTNAVVVTHEA
ncbi:RDD family protein [Streptomyces cocklensis]|uniref:RDD domain-containing protein n=1 Tax=Actinacidiphila cocklensis TaxID=887465 RepID=A0A9W4DV95_9ACTN|nr:RDD family protein [Actinacidiphila cocklensis]MDD1060905.1 RDD family protein [Actinacidiphila cocklensis]CAG6396675.1 putative RDD domain-containing protein [Actinacidiphila cocklensis]